MVDNYPSSPFRHHAEAELSSDSVCGDSLADSASGTVLDPDLEGILRQERFLAFIDGENMSQVAERLREEKPGEFDLAGQMAEAIRVLWMITKIRRRTGGLEKEARDCWRFLTLWRTWLLLRRWSGF